MLSARGYNIESLTVASTLDPELSRMSIVVDVDPASQRAQVIKQMNKLINVLQVSDLTEASPQFGARNGADPRTRHYAEHERPSSRKPRSSARARWTQLG